MGNPASGTRMRAKPSLPVTRWDSDLIYKLIEQMSKKENAKVLFGMKDKNEVCYYEYHVYLYM
jgi:hypothetical protein